jgi:glycosyltransferase involved in cell wall biosynthesis
VVLNTSPYESYGAAMLEALAAGVPVVAPDVGIARQYGAYIAERTELSKKTIEVLQKNLPATLEVVIPTAHAWAQAWRASLV